MVSIQYFHGRRQLKQLIALSKDLSLMNSVITKCAGRKKMLSTSAAWVSFISNAG